MWSAAEISKVALSVESDLAVLQAIDQFQFIWIVLLGKIGYSIRPSGNPPG
jgi:hypothetical protein